MTRNPRARWAEPLSVPADAPPDAAAAAFLRALPGADFLPPAESVAAVNALAGTPAPVGRDYGVEQMLREEADEFVARFWALAPAKRLTTWKELARRGVPEACLRELEPGLGVSTDPLEDPDADELARLFRDLFILPPRERAIRRNAWLAEHALDAFRWRAALVVLTREAADIPALDPRFRAVLGPNFDLAAFSAGISLKPARRAVAANLTEFSAQIQKQEDEAARQRTRRIEWGVSIVLALLLVGGGLIWVFSSANRSEPKFTPPDNGSGKPQRVFAVGEVLAFERHERDVKVGKHPLTPDGYRDWVHAGRPRTDQGAKPGESAPVFTFDAAQIRGFQAYHQSRRGPKPALYDVWVQVGRPSEPVSFRVPQPTP